MYTHTHTYTLKHKWTYIHIKADIYTHTHENEHVQIYARNHLCIQIHTKTLMYTHKQTHENRCILESMHIPTYARKHMLTQSVSAANTQTASPQRGKTPAKEYPGYDTKQSDGEVPVMLELWEMRSTPSLPSHPGPIWPEVVAPDRVLSMGQKELNCELRQNWIAWNRNALILKLYFR